MRRIRPDYYDKFQCIADRCTITCCQEWKIAVDAETNRKWKKLLPPEDVKPQKKNLSAYTTNRSGNRVIGLTEDHKCPFLNNNKLCKLVTAYGDKVLSETCAVFPREVHSFEDHEEETLMPCCPAVIDLLAEAETDIGWKGTVEDTETDIDWKGTIEETETDIGWKETIEETKTDIGLKETVEEAGQTGFEIRDGILKVFSDNTQSAEELLLSGFYILSELYRIEEENEAEGGVSVTERFLKAVQEYFQDKNVKELQDAIRAIPADTIGTMEEQNELLQDLAVNYRKEGLYRKYLDPVIGMAEQLSDAEETFAEDEEAILAFQKKFMAYQPLMRQFLRNEILSDLCTPGGDLMSMMVHFQWIAMEYGVIRHCIYLEWIRNGKKEIPYETVRDYIVVICRMTGYEEDDIYEYLENSFESLIWDWGYLALVVGR